MRIDNLQVNNPSASQKNNSESEDDEENKTIFCANLSDRVSEELLCELFLQAGPVESVRIPTDKNGRQRNFGFVTYVHSCSVNYALALFEGIQLYNRILTLQNSAIGSSNSNQRSKELPLPLPPPLLNQACYNPNYPPSQQPYFIDFNPEVSVYDKKSKYDNSALRYGNTSSSLQINFDPYPKPESIGNDALNNDNKGTRPKNPFKIDFDTLSRLSSNILPKPKESYSNRDGNRRFNDNDFGLQHSSEDKYRYRDKRDHPYKRPQTKNNAYERFERGGYTNSRIRRSNERSKHKQKRRI